VIESQLDEATLVPPELPLTGQKPVSEEMAIVL
jgi:hypothetical protein